jgi:hypothetical protein
MRNRRPWFAMVGLAMLTGCASPAAIPRYVTNFNQVRPGMSKSEVCKLLGLPSLVATQSDSAPHVSLPDPNESWSSFRRDVDAVFVGSELWQYGRYDINDWQQASELLDGSPKSFAVWFDDHGHVTRFRRPQQGPYADTTQPSPRPPASPSDLGSGDPFGRDTGQATPHARP